MPIKVEFANGKARVTAGAETRELPTEEFNRRQAEILGIAASAQRLEQVNFDVLFRNELHPIQAGDIDVGDRVFVRAAMQFGQVIRKHGETYRVEMAPDSAINTYWEAELEKRA